MSRTVTVAVVYCSVSVVLVLGHLCIVAYQ